MSKLDRTEESRLLKAAEQVAKHVKAGVSPVDAMCKVALESELTPGRVRSVSHAYNTGCQLSQWKGNKTIAEKLATFDLIDPDEVIDRCWGSTKTAADKPSELPSGIPWMNRPTQALEKVAYVAMDLAESDPMKVQQNTRHWVSRSQSRVKIASRDCVAHRDVLQTKIASLERYFQQPPQSRMSFSDFDDAMSTYYGRTGQAVAGLVRGLTKTAQDQIHGRATIRHDTSPVTLAMDVLAAAKLVTAADREKAAAEEDAATAKVASNLFYWAVSPLEKTADLGMLLLGGYGKDMLDKAVSGETKDKAVSKHVDSLSDPRQMNDLRRIRAAATLASVLGDKSSPISRYDPHKVLNAYNELSSGLPRSTELSMSLRPLLAKRLAGHMEPFEVGDAVTTENRLKTLSGQGSSEPSSK